MCGREMSQWTELIWTISDIISYTYMLKVLLNAFSFQIRPAIHKLNYYLE